MKHFVLVLLAAFALSSQSFAQGKMKRVYASSNKLDVELLQDNQQVVQLNRYFFAGYNTLCLPMSLTAEQVALAAKDLKVERLAGIKQEGESVNLYFVDCTNEGIQAGVPYLVYSPTAQYMRIKNSDAMNVSTNLEAVCLSDNNGNQVSFSSSWVNIQKAGRYGIPAKQDVTPLRSILVKTDAEKQFLPTRCGFDWVSQSATARDLRIQHVASMNEVTAITETKASRSASKVSYDLNGRKMTGQNKKGVVVLETGEKVFVK